jgi:hypothetical protein
MPGLPGLGDRPGGDAPGIADPPGDLADRGGQSSAAPATVWTLAEVCSTAAAALRGWFARRCPDPGDRGTINPIAEPVWSFKPLPGTTRVVFDTAPEAQHHLALHPNIAYIGPAENGSARYRIDFTG